MRTIKFRGQRVDNGEWVYGDLMHYVMGEDQLVYTTSIRSAIIYHVKPETVGQFTGLQDKNGVDIYEMDVLKSVYILTDYRHNHFGVVKYDNLNSKFYSHSIDNEISRSMSGINESIEVIGNTHQNPELLNK